MKKIVLMMLIVLPLVALTSSCDSDDDNTPIQITKTYQLASVSDPAISGTAKFIKNDDNSTTVELQLSGTPAGGMHPANIHINTAAEGSPITVVALGTVDGDTGFSTVTFDQLNDTTPVTYDDMLDFDGYINVHLSGNEDTLVAQGDIGQNELTVNAIVYTLDEVNTSGISGTAVIVARANGETLLTISLDGTQAGTNHVTHIHDGSVANPGAVAITLTTVDGETGKSQTSISKKDDDTPITFSNLQTFEGYLNIHASESDLTVVAQGDIGLNTLN